MFEELMVQSVEGSSSRPVPVPWLVWADGLPCGKRVRASDPMSALDKAGFDLDKVDEVGPFQVGDFVTYLEGKRVRILRVR